MWCNISRFLFGKSSLTFSFSLLKMFNERKTPPQSLTFLFITSDDENQLTSQITKVSSIAQKKCHKQELDDYENVTRVKTEAKRKNLSLSSWEVIILWCSRWQEEKWIKDDVNNRGYSMTKMITANKKRPNNE